MTYQEMISDLVRVASDGVANSGPGTLVLNTNNKTAVFMTQSEIENDIELAECEEDPDQEVILFLKEVSEEIEEVDFSKEVLLTFIKGDDAQYFIHPCDS